MSVYSASDALTFMRDVVDEAGGDYVYDTTGNIPLNVHLDSAGNRVGGCIVGRIFERFIPIDYIPMLGCVGEVNNGLGCPFDDGAVYVLRCAQFMNDAGRMWGDILMQAELHLAAIESKTIKPRPYRPAPLPLKKTFTHTFTKAYATEMLWDSPQFQLIDA